MSAGRTKDEVLDALRAERARWEALLIEAGETRLTQPGVVDDWSVKDLLGHLAAYLRYWGAQIRGTTSGVPPTPRELFGTDVVPEGLGTVSLDEQNAMIRARFGELSVPETLAEWRRAFDLLTDGVAALSEEDLTASGRFAWTGSASVADAMAVPTYLHARAHAEDVRAWLDRRGSG